MDTIEEIIKLKALLDQGAITKGEFNSLKKKVLFEDTDFQEPQKTSAPSSIESGIGSEVINDANTVQKEINKKPSSFKKPIGKGKNPKGFQEPNEGTLRLMNVCSGLGLLTGCLFGYRYDSFLVLFITATISIALTIILARLVSKLSIRNFTLVIQSVILFLLIIIPIGSVSNASSSYSSSPSSSTETSENERPMLHCKWCKKDIIGKPHEDIYDYTIEPDGIGIIIFNSGTKYGYCSEKCAKNASYAGYGYTQH